MMKSKLVIRNVTKQFGNFRAVADVSASVVKGRITAFIGPNGAGKTTLFHVLSGELTADHGYIMLDEQNIGGLPPWRVARMGIGRQFQDVRVFGGLTVLDNVLVALLSPGEQSPFRAWRGAAILKSHSTEAEYWVEFVGLADLRDKRADDLSFGQQKLLSFARLMAGGFALLLLDEPTAGLARSMVDRVVGLLHKIVKERGVTIALIEHNMSVVEALADWVYFMNEGQVAFTGRSDHVLGNRDVREIYMGL